MVYVKYKCVVCGSTVEEVFDFGSQFNKFADNLDMQLCELHKGS